MEDIHLAQARLEDFAEVAALFEALHRYNASLDECFGLADNWYALLHDYFNRTCHDPQTLWLLAWHQGQPVGLLIVKAHIDSPLFQYRAWTELVAIYVAAAWRGTTLGQCLVEKARDWTAAHNCSRLQLYVTASNERARAFYRRCGLRPVQEIWRLDVVPDSNGAPFSEDGTAAEDADFLEPGHHHYLHEQKKHE